jgi:endopeptidase La
MKDSIGLKLKLEDEIDYAKKINEELRERYREIYNMMSRVQENFEKKAIKKDKYNVIMEKLDDLVSEYKNLNYPVTIEDLNTRDRYEMMTEVMELKTKIRDQSLECGSNRCMDLLNLHFDKTIIDNFSNEYKKLVEFYNNFFVPISCSFEQDKSNIQLSVDILPFAKKSSGSNKSFLEKIEGADVYFPSKNNFLVVSGYFEKDPLNITRLGGTFGEKMKQVENKVQYLTLEKNFKEQFLNQISLRDFIVNNESDICDLIESAHKDLIKYRTKPLSILVKEFITANTEKQRYILTLFLLSDSEDQFLAHIIYDMICNTSDLLKPQPMAEEIYKSLHYSIQKLFRIAFKNVESKIANLQSLTEDDIPYEKRIAMMKASDNIKSKALEKLKEIKGTRESSAKAQQYLDGLLKIPFGIYRKEPVLSFLSDFSTSINSNIKESIDKLNEYRPDSPFKTHAKDSLLKYLNSYVDKVDRELTIDNFIKNLDTTFNEIKEYKSPRNSFDAETKDNKTNLLIDVPVDNEGESGDKEEDEIISTNEKFLEKLQKMKELSNMLENDITSPVEIDSIEENDKDKSDNLESESVLLSIENQFMKKMKEWLNYKISKKNYLKTIRENLNSCVYGHDESKGQLERLIAQWMNGKMEGTVFGFQGPPGTGKTSLAKKGLSKCLLDEDGNPRPFGFLPLGGSSNGAILEGHSYTYLGSTWGRIADILMETKCMNPIIYIDEVDKVSQTEHGREIIGILTHLTDQSQNVEFTDKYFAGIKFDLSKVLFVFSYNDASLIDRILRDRITEINIRALTLNEKVHIVQDYALPEILETVGYKKGDIYIEKENIKYIIQNYTNEAGVRKLREKLFEIVREINLKKITDDDNISLPFEITEDFIKEIFSDKPKVQVKKIAKEPQVGFVNGLYATVAGTGGLTIVEVVKTPSDRKLSLELTGQQGDVMKESMICAKTLAWNLLPKSVKKDIAEEQETFGNFGLHIHCPEASTPKDGPSAGITITTAIVSRLCNIKVRNDVAMTGEIDLHGNVHAIGGLDAKLEGAKRAGVELVLVPKDNEDDYKKILKKLDEQVDSPRGREKLPDVIIVNNIMEVIKNALVENDLEFVNIFKN